MVDRNHEVLQGPEADQEVLLAQEVDQEVLQEVDLEVDPVQGREADPELEVEHQKIRRKEEEAKKDQEAQRRKNRRNGELFITVIYTANHTVITCTFTQS